ncbi:hypothetical protein GGR42_001777 [Saonia flava]|uniref:PD-(D/E)XK endonuclease-like domain-containing protein n=1 Tax=Saonia flava TaxID=523696 RepID=A0A846R077_9FLAO|nr:PD-(D/E)XK nuclease family protein [Saonia flava]NJB71315.1 hypothetical protein [Saonia flava]
MQSFLEEVISNIWAKYKSFDNVVFILPSKRAGTFLKNNLAKTAKKTFFSPKIYSIESFVEKVSGISYASNTQQLFELYNSYLKTYNGEKDEFHSFSKWGQTLLQDINEIDRYLVNPQQIFSYLYAIKELDYWDKTKMMKAYIHFWKNLEQLYTHFNSNLIDKGIGHQGLVYRKATANIEDYIAVNSKQHIFIGFNALNKAEDYIIQKILEYGIGDIYWDIDSYFLEDPIHDAGYFIRQHKKNWPYFRDNPLKGFSNIYLSQKNIQVIGVPKSVSQAKYVGGLLKDLKEKDGDYIKNTAVILGDETLLNPIINSIPKEIEGINITMGYPLHKTPVASLFSQLFELYISTSSKGWYFKNVIDVLSHPYVQILLSVDEENSSSKISEEIIKKNWVHINLHKMGLASQKKSSPLSLLFYKNPDSPIEFVEKSLRLIEGIKNVFIEKGNSLGLEYLYRFNRLFNQLDEVIKKHSFIKDLKTLYGLYQELISSETLDFQGEPLKGLQVMGMLESRNLDFETVIITSVNEGILPSGKSNNSFIPFDVKKEYDLPTYKEKDAVYTYHFYRLLHRAKNVYILYNTEPDVLEGGEKSRLITQLLTDENKAQDIIQIIASPEIQAVSKNLEQVQKGENLINEIKKLASKGFSPSSLSNYIRNPIDFYKQSILKINDVLEVEENVAANTFGTIVHDTLEELYMPFVGSFLTQENLMAIKTSIPKIVTSNFKKTYSDGDITSGKNLIAYNVVLKYIETFIQMEIHEVKNHQIKIIGLEEKLEVKLNIAELDFPVILKGKLDRIDEKDGVIRIIDYKTGKVEARDVKLTDWEGLNNDYKKNKAFQLLCYALMYNEKESFQTIEAGIYSFKNLKSGLLKFKAENAYINEETLTNFKASLKELILEICNPEISFLEKEL